MSIKHFTAAVFLLACTANGQTVIGTTNNVTGYVTPSSTFSGPAGAYRITVTVTEDGTTAMDVSDISVFRLRIYDATDNPRHLLHTITNTVTPDADLSSGQVRWTTPSLNARRYELLAEAIPYETNDTFIVAWHYLDVTNTVSSGISITVTNADQTQFGFVGATNTPGFVRLYSGDSLATGVVDGANLSLYLPDESGGTVDLSTLSNNVLGAWATASNASAVANAAATGTPLYVESDLIFTNWLWTTDSVAYRVSYPIQIVNGTATISAVNGRWQRLQMPTNTTATMDVASKGSSNNWGGPIFVGIYPPPAGSSLTFNTNTISSGVTNVTIYSNKVTVVGFISPPFESSLQWGVGQFKE